MTRHSLTPIPKAATGQDRDELTGSYRKAVRAYDELEGLLQEAALARRRAKYARDRYEELVMKFNGQLTMFEEQP